VAGVECPPSSFQLRFKPRAEIHGNGSRRDADVPEVTGSGTGEDMRRTAQGDGKILKVAADADALGVNIQGRSGRASVWISELHPATDPIHDLLHASPPRRGIAEEFCRDAGEAVHFLATTIHSVRQVVVRQLLLGVLPRLIIYLVLIHLNPV
jgi:hypothetical protein